MFRRKKSPYRRTALCSTMFTTSLSRKNSTSEDDVHLPEDGEPPVVQRKFLALCFSLSNIVAVKSSSYFSSDVISFSFFFLFSPFLYLYHFLFLFLSQFLFLFLLVLLILLLLLLLTLIFLFHVLLLQI